MPDVARVAAKGVSGRMRIIAEAVGSSVSILINNDSRWFRAGGTLTTAPAAATVGLYHESPGGSDLTAPPADMTK